MKPPSVIAWVLRMLCVVASLAVSSALARQEPAIADRAVKRKLEQIGVLEALSRYPDKEIAAIFQICRDTDRLIRGGKSDDAAWDRAAKYIGQTSRAIEILKKNGAVADALKEIVAQDAAKAWRTIAAIRSEQAVRPARGPKPSATPTAPNRPKQEAPRTGRSATPKAKVIEASAKRGDEALERCTRMLERDLREPAHAEAVVIESTAPLYVRYYIEVVSWEYVVEQFDDVYVDAPAVLDLDLAYVGYPTEFDSDLTYDVWGDDLEEGENLIVFEAEEEVEETEEIEFWYWEEIEESEEEGDSEATESDDSSEEMPDDDADDAEPADDKSDHPAEEEAADEEPEEDSEEEDEDPSINRLLVAR